MVIGGRIVMHEAEKKIGRISESQANIRPNGAAAEPYCAVQLQIVLLPKRSEIHCNDHSMMFTLPFKEGYSRRDVLPCTFATFVR